MSTERSLGRTDIARAIAPLAERHAEHRLPLSALLELVHATARAAVSGATALATTPEQRSELADIEQRLLEVTGHIVIIAAESYSVVERETFGRDRGARRELLAALLSGSPAQGHAAKAGISLAGSYTVLAIDLDATAAPDVPELVARRREQVIARGLDDLSTSTVLFQFDGSTGIALLADTAIAPDRFDQLAERLRSTLDARPYLGLLPGVALEEIPSAVADARELALFARLRGRPPACYRLDDLLLELQITRPGRAKQRLIELLEPVAGHPHLIAALQAHLQHGADRQAAARELFVHPNTFTYRLNRITELTGLDPTQPREGRTLAAALTIRILEGPTAGQNLARPNDDVTAADTIEDGS
ncbi:PucR family transcriptional regulator [Nocardia sp. NPDC060259]|uniref:PucR family transcriptional regulator n=1 Tax=Nocardia sp. NPDC060259 TaxID=3347088 RepID=UPI00364FBA5E